MSNGFANSEGDQGDDALAVCGGISVTLRLPTDPQIDRADASHAMRA